MHVGLVPNSGSLDFTGTIHCYLYNKFGVFFFRFVMCRKTLFFMMSIAYLKTMLQDEIYVSVFFPLDKTLFLA
jgi:hypothetical protein